LWKGESIPPTRDGRLKFNYEVSFTNKQFHEASDQVLSVPPRQGSGSPWGDDVPEVLKDEIRRVVDHTYGDHIAGRQIEGYRMCWSVLYYHSIRDTG
jgi:sarcosine oxidase/L-pipecolate oxidase